MRFAFRNLLGFLTGVLLLAAPAQAEVSVMFHPYDPTLTSIAKVLGQAKHTIDMALYNIDVSDSNPVIAFFKSKPIQERIKSGELEVRLIYEGYAEPAEEEKKCRSIEALGIDVRRMMSSLKMHHKFAVIDGFTEAPLLVTGSANWSMASFQFYDENILFARDEAELAHAYERQFTLLWGVAKEIGDKLSDIDKLEVPADQQRDTLFARYNSENFQVKNNRLVKRKDGKGFTLTKAIVAAIDKASETVEIATTRIVLMPVYNAIQRALKRHVKVTLLVSMDQYAYPSMRKAMKLPVCEDEFEQSCSSNDNFAHFLNTQAKEGQLEVRIKFYNLNPTVYLSKQMHSKYVIIDGERVLTGSFNWSYSAEYGHIENVVEIDGKAYPELVQTFRKNYEAIFSRNRENYAPFKQRLTDALASGSKTDCAFEPISLRFEEIDSLLDLGRPFKKNLRDACK